MNTARDSRQVLNDPPPPAASERHVYGSLPLQFGDLRWPDAEGPHPLVILLHGGAWKSTFNLIHTGHMAIALAEQGYATFNVEYRRVGDPGGGWPGAMKTYSPRSTTPRGCPKSMRPGSRSPDTPQAGISRCSRQLNVGCR